jgi:3-hydroxyisobutyrate dehydrogenase-like beta-hydroxyacid dehydrogenase
MTAHEALDRHTVGWIGTGRMGFAMAARLLEAGARVTVHNRTRAKAEPLAELGARIVDSPRELADRDIVFTMVSGPDSFLEVTVGESGVLSHDQAAPARLVDCSTVSVEASATVRKAAAERGTAMIDAPVSGNAKVVESGKLAIVASGERAAYDDALPFLEALGEGVTYVGEGERARVVKICHNVFLGVVAQSLAEIVVLAEKGGIRRHALLDFINKSVMGSRFSRYKTPAYVNLDYTPTFTPALLLKDLDLGLDEGRRLGAPLPLASQVRDIVQTLIGHGYTDCDFAALLELAAKAANHKLEPENVDVDNGL